MQYPHSAIVAMPHLSTRDLANIFKRSAVEKRVEPSPLSFVSAAELEPSHADTQRNKTFSGNNLNEAPERERARRVGALVRSVRTIWSRLSL
jgi:hypothetical protein